jgi:asparagine synthase (glutamine-hydrolysing)
MCGIAGWVDSSPEQVAGSEERRRLLDAMCRVMRHRGPDDQGEGYFGNASIGMRRLSIIDVSGGRQPIGGCDAHINVVFNGEIYNFLELKQELEGLGHRFSTRSDTEAIVHCYEQFGTACVERLRGMFAFAIWDENLKRLFIARDRVGKKPLYYSVTSKGTLVFGSELKCLLEHRDVERKISSRAVDAYLALGYVPDPLSIFEGIHKLPPGSFLLFEKGNVRIEQYWDFDYSEGDGSRTEEEVVEELRTLIDEAVRIRLVSDVPLGAFLSGGVDSSSVVGVMARHMTQAVKTFSIGFREDTYDELKYARVAAKHFKTDHTEFIVTPDICELVDKLVLHFDEPFADSSALPTYMVSKLARERVTVALSGDGGDELFAGYTRYGIDRARSSFARMPRFVRSGVIGPLSARLPHGAYGRNFLHNISLDAISRYTDSVSVFTALGRNSLYSPAFARQLGDHGGVLQSMSELADKVGTGEELDRLLYIDSKTYLPGDILTKVDRMSMAASLEARVPLLDHKLIDFVTKIPASMKMHGRETKYIFKRAMRGIVPDEILYRKKQGFGVPIQRWINNELKTRIRDVVLDQRAIDRGYFNQGYLELLFDEHARNRRDHSQQLWSLFMLELWHQSYLDRDSEHGDFHKDEVSSAVELCAPPV